MTNEYVMKNYPFYSWVPKPFGILILLLLFVPLFFSGGTYLSNINEMTGGLGALSEQFQLLNLCTFIGMSLVFPFYGNGMPSISSLAGSCC